MDSSKSSVQEIKTLGTQLWAPFGLIARPTHCELWDALPPAPSKQPAIIEESILYSDLAGKLKSFESKLGREQVQRRKIQSRQFALYEGASTNDVFLPWAFQPTQTALRKLLTDLLKELGHGEPEWPDKAEQLRLILRFLAVRIAWDKGKLEGADRTSPETILNRALTYPTNLYRHPEGRDLRLAEDFVNAMPPVNLGIVDGATLSQILQINGFDPRDAGSMEVVSDAGGSCVENGASHPHSEIRRGLPVVWDGTCGTGTLLVTALERFRQLIGDNEISRQKIAETIHGNDREPLLADLTRINLEIAAGDIDGQPWDISSQDVLHPDENIFPRRPSIILGNPPFGSSGRGPDYAIDIINMYLSVLKPGGMISTIMPRTLLGATGAGARAFRANLLNSLEIFEIWDAPQGFVPHTSSELAVISARKRFTHENTRSPIIWKILDPRREKSAMVDVVPSPDIWMTTRQLSIEPPLLLKLRALIGDHPSLADLMTGTWITEGITPGADGRGEVLNRYESGALRYLTGRSGMDPFNISWSTNPRWIRYESPNIWRPRRSRRALFEGRKVLLGRWATGGHPWVSRAAIDDGGIYPSEDFIVIAPEPILSCEFVCGLLNSALINCWLKLVNPSRTIRIGACRSIPMPINSTDESVQSVVRAVTQITALRKHKAAEREGGPTSAQEGIINATIALDRAVYDMYGIPAPVRQAIGDYYTWYEKPRLGFDTDSWESARVDLPPPPPVFPEPQASRLRSYKTWRYIGTFPNRRYTNFVPW